MRHLHSLSICHRDLKLENLLLAEEGSHSLIKVTDFGLAKIWGSGEVLETYVGTPVYMAPEVVACAGDNTSSYSSKSDCWSLGVILYLLLSGRHPFPSNAQCADSEVRNAFERTPYVTALKFHVFIHISKSFNFRCALERILRYLTKT